MSPLMILVAGPYRSGTNDDPARIARNVAAMTEASLQLFRAGHLPVMGEWYALPLIEQAGSGGIGDAVFDEIFHPVSRRLLERCDACLRIGGASAGADEMVALARQHGKPVYHAIEQVPRAMGHRPLQTCRGSCHCGAVRFEIDTDFPELTQCDCSICRRKNALMVKVHESRFRLLAGAQSLTEYQFHTHTARHFFCKVCGIYPFHRKRVTPDHLGINVHCLEGFDPSGIPVRRAVGAAMP